ncbi:hypothetical protein MaudCBS49596_002675 [Microsporum audouinii]
MSAWLFFIGSRSEEWVHGSQATSDFLTKDRGEGRRLPWVPPWFEMAKLVTFLDQFEKVIRPPGLATAWYWRYLGIRSQERLIRLFQWKENIAILSGASDIDSKYRHGYLKPIGKSSRPITNTTK